MTSSNSMTSSNCYYWYTQSVDTTQEFHTVGLYSKKGRENLTPYSDTKLLNISTHKKTNR